MQAANNAHRGIAFKYTRRKKLNANANALAAKQKVPKPSEAPKPKGVWGTRVAAAAVAAPKNKNSTNRKLAANIGKPPRHRTRSLGRYPNSLEQYPPVWYGPKGGPKPKEKTFLEFLREQSKNKKGARTPLEDLQKMTFGKVFPKPYKILEQMTETEGMEWIQRQPEEEVDKILSYF